ncbi:MAG: hypothetical protein H7X93_06000 [Sphingomonadaceae bacterium]|nr:hypothetical protein [Sphingomonadaceae bacterium]
MKRKPDSPDPESAQPAAPALAEPDDLTDLLPTPAPANALVAEPEPEPRGLLDDYHERPFDPADYRWVPVLRKRRADGWSPRKQVRFIEALADTGCVQQACDAVGMSRASCYALRRSPGAEGFAAAWDAAIAQAAKMLIDLAFDRAIHGSDEPVFNPRGDVVGRRMRQNDRLLMFLLRAYMPARFRHAHQDIRHAGEATPSASAPVAEALTTLEPVAPPDPHLLMPPEELETELQCAEILQGKLPHWYRDDPPPPPSPISPLGEEFERELAWAKQGVDPPAEGWPDDPESQFIKAQCEQVRAERDKVGRAKSTDDE